MLQNTFTCQERDKAIKHVIYSPCKALWRYPLVMVSHTVSVHTHSEDHAGKLSKMQRPESGRIADFAEVDSLAVENACRVFDYTCVDVCPAPLVDVGFNFYFRLVLLI